MPDLSDPAVLRQKLVLLFSLVFAVAVHEFAHAWAAFRLGDDHAAREGRLTLNPLAHADPIGTLLVPLLAGFGWGRPVPYIPTNLTRRFSMRAGEAMIAFAGPAANLLLAVVLAVLWKVFLVGDVLPPDSPFWPLIKTGVFLNLLLFFFNLLPVPPLDGSKIVAWVFGQRADEPLRKLEELGFVGVLLAIVVGGAVISPAVGFSFLFLVAVLGLY